MQSAFPEGFLWGTATSSHQVEGENQANDWWEWERDASHLFDGAPSGKALEWWTGRAEEDLARAAGLGQNAHRLSLEWSRLEPEPGKWDDRAFERYVEMLRAARSLGITPMVTLNHFTLPRWLAQKGGWLSNEAAARFASFATESVARLEAHAELWATLNEPNVLAYLGYGGTRWPPGRGEISAALRAYAAMLRAHALAYRAIKARSARARVGLVLSLPVFDPARATVRDRAPASMTDWAFSGAALHALSKGRLVPPLGASRVPGLRGALDWLGVNYYGRYTVEFDPRSPEFFGRRPSAGHIKTPWSDWGEPWAEGLTRRLLQLGKLGVPLYVTENGIRDPRDELRPDFLRQHIAAVARALRGGADVRGYFHWSLVDNFEWAEGWSSPFGLYALDRTTGLRAARPSAAVYASLCRSNGATLPPER